MAYRNGTYVAFHAGGTTDPTASDIRYYRILKAWNSNKNRNFSITDSHDKNRSVRDSSKKETLRTAIVERLSKSKNLLLITTNETRKDDDWVPYEIMHAIDTDKIPIIVTYPGYTSIRAPNALSHLWPTAFKTRIEQGIGRSIHIPFTEHSISTAIDQFSHNNLPLYPTTSYKNGTG